MMLNHDAILQITYCTPIIRRLYASRRAVADLRKKEGSLRRIQFPFESDHTSPLYSASATWLSLLAAL